jgi:UDPglucose 6-dehydrogenase
MKLAVLGTGATGLVTATGLAALGHQVAAVDGDQRSVELLNRGGAPEVYEPGLHALMVVQQVQGRLRFEPELGPALSGARAAFLAIEDSAHDGGELPPPSLARLVRAIARQVEQALVLVVESTLPPGSCDALQALADTTLRERGLGPRIELACQPLALRSGRAVKDFMWPDRIVVGTGTPAPAALLREIYAPLLAQGTPFMTMGVRSAEMVRYAAHAWLAARIGFCRELASVAGALGADIHEVSEGLGGELSRDYARQASTDPQALQCAEDELRTLCRCAERHGLEPRLLAAVQDVGERRFGAGLASMEAGRKALGH